MDSIWNCAFGMDIDLQNNPDNLYMHNSENIFRKVTHPTVCFILSS